MHKVGRLIWSLIWICGSTVIQAQSLHAEYELLLNLGFLQRYRSHLFLTGHRALFEWGLPTILEEASDEREININFRARDSLGKFNYTDAGKGFLYSRVETFEDEIRILREPVPDIEWKIRDITKRIGPYICRLADGRFRGRNYEVWFTPEVPTRFGPWKLHGLPGLVVRVQEGNSALVLRLVRLRSVKGMPESRIGGFSEMDLTAYREMLRDRPARLLRRIQTKMPRGTRLRITDQEDLEVFKE